MIESLLGLLTFWKRVLVVFVLETNTQVYVKFKVSNKSKFEEGRTLRIPKGAKVSEFANPKIAELSRRILGEKVVITRFCPLNESGGNLFKVWGVLC